jgi:hypothetical protein
MLERRGFVVTPAMGFRLMLFYNNDIFKTAEIAQTLPRNIYTVPLNPTKLTLTQDRKVVRLTFQNVLLQEQKEFYENPLLCRTHPKHGDCPNIPHHRFINLSMDLFRLNKECSPELLTELELYVDMQFRRIYHIRPIEAVFHVKQIFTLVSRGKDTKIREVRFADDEARRVEEVVG